MADIAKRILLQFLVGILKIYECLYGYGVDVKFQFLIGTLKTCYVCLEKRYAILVSIPYRYPQNYLSEFKLGS